VLHARAVDRVARREVVRAIEHDRGAWHFAIEPGVVHAFGDRVHPHFGIDARQRVTPGLHLLAADGRAHMQDLPLQIGEVDGVVVHERKAANT
jgi:hypothetical protein